METSLHSEHIIPTAPCDGEPKPKLHHSGIQNSVNNKSAFPNNKEPSTLDVRVQKIARACCQILSCIQQSLPEGDDLVAVEGHLEIALNILQSVTPAKDPSIADNLFNLIFESRDDCKKSSFKNKVETVCGEASGTSIVVMDFSTQPKLKNPDQSDILTWMEGVLMKEQLEKDSSWFNKGFLSLRYNSKEQLDSREIINIFRDRISYQKIRSKNKDKEEEVKDELAFDNGLVLFLKKYQRDETVGELLLGWTENYQSERVKSTKKICCNLGEGRATHLELLQYSNTLQYLVTLSDKKELCFVYLPMDSMDFYLSQLPMAPENPLGYCISIMEQIKNNQLKDTKISAFRVVDQFIYAADDQGNILRIEMVGSAVGFKLEINQPYKTIGSDFTFCTIGVFQKSVLATAHSKNIIKYPKSGKVKVMLLTENLALKVETVIDSDEIPQDAAFFYYRGFPLVLLAFKSKIRLLTTFEGKFRELRVKSPLGSGLQGKFEDPNRRFRDFMSDKEEYARGNHGRDILRDFMRNIAEAPLREERLPARNFDRD